MIAVRLRFSEPTATVQYSPKQWRDLTKVCWAIVESTIVVEMWSHQSRYCGKLTLEHNGCDIYSMLPPIVSHRSSYLAPLAWHIRVHASCEDTRFPVNASPF